MFTCCLLHLDARLHWPTWLTWHRTPFWCLALPCVIPAAHRTPSILLSAPAAKPHSSASHALVHATTHAATCPCRGPCRAPNLAACPCLCDGPQPSIGPHHSLPHIRASSPQYCTMPWGTATCAPPMPSRASIKSRLTDLAAPRLPMRYTRAPASRTPATPVAPFPSPLSVALQPHTPTVYSCCPRKPPCHSRLTAAGTHGLAPWSASSPYSRAALSV